MVSQHNVAAAPMTAEANLREQVQQRLRLDIVSGEVGPGTILSVPGLARTLGISTTPVREALLQLSDDGLLQPLRNRGFCVVEPTLEDLRNLFEVRLQLETSAFVKLVRSGLADVAELTRQADAIARAVRTRDVPLYLAADRAFHRELLSRAGNAVLTGIVMRLRDTMRLYGIGSPAGLARQEESVPEHYRIIALLQQGSETDAAALMHKHIMDWEPIFSDYLKAPRDGAVRA
ncbi:GntR family transcriptional regulator [Methylobacterium frigidaeris]|uniref:HTH-type transcriptional regulator LutR n=1 Tax=Methylobacterium frigidaeris TaxID=2038277 RepID=A0AA37M891_9HYPH|nr:GntR family transcriptional regulator [Methylobacterium frigidaeris]GJD66082.1 HTH-type transcriptional regulator LutR [Methylobacterium frigidaeris]